MEEFIELIDMHNDHHSVAISTISSILWGFCFKMRDMITMCNGEKLYINHKSPSSYALAKAVGVKNLDKFMDETNPDQPLYI